jgi:hypothetical protein
MALTEGTAEHSVAARNAHAILLHCRADSHILAGFNSFTGRAPFSLCALRLLDGQACVVATPTALALAVGWLMMMAAPIRAPAAQSLSRELLTLRRVGPNGGVARCFAWGLLCVRNSF